MNDARAIAPEDVPLVTRRLDVDSLLIFGARRRCLHDLVTGTRVVPTVATFSADRR